MASTYFSKGLKRSALTVALGMCFAGGVNAQSTSGAIFGKADPGPVDTARALPLTYFVGGFLLLGGIVLILADIISPIQLF